MKEVVMMVGFPASSKSTVVRLYEMGGYECLCRDVEGGRTLGLLPKMEALLKEERQVILDCTFMTVAKRKPFIELAKKYDYQINCDWMATSIEDCQINALSRMMNDHGRVFLHPEDMKGIKDPHVFPISVLFKMRKEFEKPTKDEGFNLVTKVEFTRRYPIDFTNKAIFVDYDGTLREVVGGKYKYPVSPSEVRVFQEVGAALRNYKAIGYLIFGVSNQSGIGKGHLSKEDAEACFEETNRQLGIDIPYYYCPHRIPPATCYCRKPQAGLAVPLIWKHKIDVRQSFMIGDMTSDRTFAKRLGMSFIHVDELLKV